MYYRRRLPHWHEVGVPLFVTFRLYGSLPARRFFAPDVVEAGRVFAAMDGLLDAGGSGPLYLARADVAGIVEGALLDGGGRLRRYELHAFAVMPNHVHLLVTPGIEVVRWLGPLKGFTAREANRVLGLQGPFWQEESYDRLVRSDEEFASIRRYIERNPVKAGLVGSAEDFRWSSAWAGRGEAD
ncbi:MAG: transposase [Acidobacteria bacterium]|nr:transposase [Acidobacteriota bacterium]